MIHCIGDSHVSVFTGTDRISEGYPCAFDCLDGFRTYRTGPSLAYSMGDPNHNAFRWVYSIIATFVQPGDFAMLSFGEIDCRTHVAKQAEIQNRSVEDISREISMRYSSAVITLKRAGHKMLVYAPVPTLNHYNPSAAICDENPYPHVGTTEQRNLATKIITEETARILEPEGVPVISIFNEVVDNKLNTDGSYYVDGVHLSQKVMPFILGKLSKIVK